jgi:hypothetical protein
MCLFWPADRCHTLLYPRTRSRTVIADMWIECCDKYARIQRENSESLVALTNFRRWYRIERAQRGIDHESAPRSTFQNNAVKQRPLHFCEA